MTFPLPLLLLKVPNINVPNVTVPPKKRIGCHTKNSFVSLVTNVTNN